MLVVVGTVYAAAAALIIMRVPGNRLGPVFLIAAWLWAVDLVLSQCAVNEAVAPATSTVWLRGTR